MATKRTVTLRSKSIMSEIKQRFPGALCFFSVGCVFMILGWALGSPFTVYREVRDRHGSVIYDAFGEPHLEPDRFGNFLAHWQENGSFLLGSISIAIGVLFLFKPYFARLFLSRSTKAHEAS